MLELKGISKSYGGNQVLRDVSLACKKGTVLCLAGPNASGKTTLLSIAAGLLRPEKGSVLCDGRVGFVPQQSALLEDLSLLDNLRLWYASFGRPRKAVFAPDTAEYRLGLLPYQKKRVGTLSGGYRKRGDFACALAGEPDYLILDEPFTALDLESRSVMIQLLLELKRQGKGLLFSSHDPGAIADAADAVAVLDQGGILCQEALLDTPQRASQILNLLMKRPA